MLRRIDAVGALRFHGGYAVADLPGLLASVDVCVVPSVWEDCAPLVVAEALAARLPVVGSRAGGIPDFVREGETGLPRAAGRRRGARNRRSPLPRRAGAARADSQASIEPPRGFDAYLDDLVGHYRSAIAERRRIPGARRFAVLASAGDVIRDESLLAGFAQAFGPGDDATLVIHAVEDEVPASRPGRRSRAGQRGGPTCRDR